MFLFKPKNIFDKESDISVLLTTIILSLLINSQLLISQSWSLFWTTDISK